MVLSLLDRHFKSAYKYFVILMYFQISTCKVKVLTLTRPLRKQLRMRWFCPKFYKSSLYSIRIYKQSRTLTSEVQIAQIFENSIGILNF